MRKGHNDGWRVRDQLLRLAEFLGVLDGRAHDNVFEQDERDWRLGRPSLPPILLVALALWAAVALGIECLFGATLELSRFVCLAGAVCLIPAALLLVRGNGVPGCLLLGVALGLVLAGSQASVTIYHTQYLEQPAAHHQVTLVRDARANDYGSSALALTEDNSLVRLQFKGDTGLMAGDTIVLSGAFSSPSPKSARESWRQGVVGVATVSRYETVPGEGLFAVLRSARAGAVQRISAAWPFAGQVRHSADAEANALVGDTAVSSTPPDAVLFLRAVLLGYTDNLYASALYQTVRVDGLAHLLAVSGAHLVIVCSIVMAAMRRMAFARWLAIALQALFIGSYLVLTGAPVSAVRAAVMSVLALLSFFARRRPYALGALSACIVVMLMLDPTAAFSLSFGLSVSATLGIILFNSFFSGWFSRLIGSRLPAIVDALALTTAASICTVPVSAGLFGQVSLVAPLANIVAAPVFSLVCVAGFFTLALGLVFPVVGAVLLSVLLAVVHAFCVLLGLMAQLPCASMPAFVPFPVALGLAIGIPLALWFWWPKPGIKRIVGVGVAAVSLLVVGALLPLAQGDEVVMLDVGQGDAFLVRSGPHAMLIDTGTDDIALLQGLGACGIRHLDAVLISHPDDDHCGSLPTLKGVVSVDKVLFATDLLSESSVNCAKVRGTATALVGAQGLVGLSVGDVIECGRIRFEVIGPDSFVDGGGNADSMILLMKSDDDSDGKVDHTALFCGDAESEQLAAYKAKERLSKVEIYKVGHHGSRAAITPELARFLRPAVSLVSVGEYNRYGHPVHETLAMLEDVGSVIFRTDEQGMVRCSLKPDRLEVRTLH